MSITRFQGESTYHAFVEHNALDIEQEQKFLDWCKANGFEAVRELAAPQLIQDIYDTYLDEQSSL
jgi:hypothetical protein